MANYQVFPDICVSVSYALRRMDACHDKTRYKESSELFRFLKGNPGTCVMTEKTMTDLRNILRGDYRLSKNETDARLGPLEDITAIKTVEIDKVKKKSSVVEEFFNRFINKQSKGGLNIGRIDSTYRALVADCYQGDMILVHPPNQGDRTMLSEILCLSEEPGKTFIASYDYHFINKELINEFEKMFGIVTGKPIEIIGRIKQH